MNGQQKREVARVEKGKKLGQIRLIEEEEGKRKKEKFTQLKNSLFH